MNAANDTSGSRRNRLDRDRILTGALELLDAEGFGGFTMGRLAERLNYTDMALYGHFRSRDELFDGVIEVLLSQVQVPAEIPRDDWPELLRALYGALWRLFRAHPQVLPVLLSRPLTLPVMGTGMASIRTLLLACGLTVSAAEQMLSTLTAYTLGFACLACGGYLTINETPPLPPPPRTRSRRRQGTSCPGARAGLDWERLDLRYEAGLTSVLRGLCEEQRSLTH